MTDKKTSTEKASSPKATKTKASSTKASTAKAASAKVSSAKAENAKAAKNKDSNTENVSPENVSIGNLKVTLVRSFNKALPRHKLCVKGLGLRRMRHSVTVPNNPCIRGLINKIYYLVQVEEV